MGLECDFPYRRREGRSYLACLRIWPFLPYSFAYKLQLSSSPRHTTYHHPPDTRDQLTMFIPCTHASLRQSNVSGLTGHADRF